LGDVSDTETSGSVLPVRVDNDSCGNPTEIGTSISGQPSRMSSVNTNDFVHLTRPLQGARPHYLPVVNAGYPLSMSVPMHVQQVPRSLSMPIPLSPSNLISMPSFDPTSTPSASTPSRSTAESILFPSTPTASVITSKSHHVDPKSVPMPPSNTIFNEAEWEPVLGQLRQMGFEDRRQNLELIKLHRGVMADVVEALLLGKPSSS
jgi:hypothetical protein